MILDTLAASRASFRNRGEKLAVDLLPDDDASAVTPAQRHDLPPPEFRAEAGATRVTLFGPRRFGDMTTEERLRACYQHAVLRYMSGKRMKNSTLRERFGVDSHCGRAL